MGALRDWTNEPLAALELSARLLNILTRRRIATVGQLLQLRLDDLLVNASYGMPTLQELGDKLVKEGLQLSDGWPRRTW
jgi:DNA-directed RNA polymerase alpha subunit